MGWGVAGDTFVKQPSVEFFDQIAWFIGVVVIGGMIAYPTVEFLLWFLHRENGDD